MNFFYLALSSILLSVQVNAQITLTRADFPRPSANSILPDSVLYSNVNGGTPTSHNLPGMNMIWNESTLTGTPRYQQFLSMSATPLIFQLLFLSCDYAQPLLNGGNVAGNTLTDAYEYYDYASSDSRLQVKGFGGNIFIPGQAIAIPLPALYSSPDIIYKFPMLYGNKDSSVSGFDVTLPLGGIIGDIQLKRNQKRVNEVDGWGRLTIPSGGTYDVLRHVSKIDRIDSFITGFFPIGIPTKPIEYKWLGQGMKVPVLQINGNQNGNNVTITNTTYWGGYPVGLNTGFNSTNATLYPNPANNQCAIEFSLNHSSDVDIYIYSINGTLMGEFHFANMKAGKCNELLPLNSLASGSYQVVCKTNQQTILQKLIKL